ncbi:hypothetical protein [Bacillus sp. 1P06AnD]|uniref:hypothetical protein n=1 Tax=Bacillus sp. 1P06AnD TaxID=3132208 RepID=UPI0039A359DF
MINAGLIRALFTAFLFSELYLVFMHGVLKDWPHMWISLVGSLFYAGLVERLPKNDED